MITRSSKYALIILLLIASSFTLVACNTKESEDIHLSLMGESENWNLNGYEMTFTNDKHIAGNGILTMKNYSEYMTNFFHFQTRIILNNEDEVIHSGSVGGDKTNIVEQTTGTIEGEPIHLDDISEIYMVIEWWDDAKKEDRGERIKLYPINS